MTKKKLKSFLMSKDKDEIIKLVLDLYSARKEAKEYLDFFAEPNEEQKLEQYKHIIREEFYPSGKRQPKPRLSVCRKALSDFKKLNPSEESIAELMVFYMENACQFTHDYGDMWEQYYDSVEGNFDRTLRYIVLYDLWDKYDSRINQCLQWASRCGWGFPYALNDMYEDMKAQNEILRKEYRSFTLPADD